MNSARQLSRRGFLTAAAAAGLSAVAVATHAARTDEDWLLGAQSYTFRNFNTERALREMQDLGLRHAEFYEKHIPPKSSEAQIRAFLEMCREYGVKPVAFGVSSFTKNHDANRRLFDFGKALGVLCLTASPSADAFDSLDKLVEEYGIAIGIHPHGPMGAKLDRWYSAEAIMAAVKDHHPKIGACLDTGHLIRAAQLGKVLDVAEQVRIMGKRNFGFHLKDHDNSRKIDVVLGKGGLRVEELVKAMREVEFEGFISIEYEANPDHPAPDVADCIRVWTQAAKIGGSPKCHG